MTRPSLAGIERDQARAARTGKCVDDAILASHIPALTAAVRDVLKMAAEWEAGAPDRIVGEAVASEIRAALAAHLDLTDPEGDPT